MENPKIIVIGSGWGSASFIKNIDKKYNITVISPTNNFIYTPLLVNSLLRISKNDLLYRVLNFFLIVYLPFSLLIILNSFMRLLLI